MRLFIPDIGDKLTLSQEWEFKLYQEYRNQKMLKHFGYEKFSYGQTEVHHFVSLPAGITLAVDRVYIRKGSHMAGYSSVTFRIEASGEHKKLNKLRFWAKLKDCNTIEFEETVLANRLEKVKFANEYNFSLETIEQIALTKEDVKELNKLRDSIFTLKKGDVYFENVKYEFENKHLKNLFHVGKNNKLSDINPNSTVKDKILTITHKRQLTDIKLYMKGGAFEKRDQYRVHFNNFYVLKDGETLIGEYKTIETLFKHAKAHLEKLKSDSSYKAITNFKELFS